MSIKAIETASVVIEFVITLLNQFLRACVIEMKTFHHPLNAVIIGRGSQFLLHNAPRTLHIYIFAPLSHRIERVMESFHLDHASAQELIEQRDYEFDDYARRFYGFNRHQPDLYHLLINTGIFSPVLAADFIRQALPVAKEVGA